VDLLFLASRTETLSDVVRQLKTGSNLWLQEQRTEWQHFHWQSGYGAFAVGQSAVEDVRDYIRRQREHHRVMTFQDEYRKFLAPNTASISRSGMCGIESRSPALLQSATFGESVVLARNPRATALG
jgi:hypothetical protein